MRYLMTGEIAEIDLPMHLTTPLVDRYLMSQRRSLWRLHFLGCKNT